MRRPRPSLRPPAAGRARLEQHVAEVQRTVRTCTGCGLCCTAAHNSVQILALEARRIADHLRRLPPARLAGFRARLHAALAAFGLRRGGPKVNYTCPFLEKDLSCALPPQVKPVACLAFNPLTPDRCDMEPAWYHRAHDGVEAANEALGFPSRKESIPVAVLRDLGDPLPAVPAAHPSGRRGARPPRHPRGITPA